MTDSVVHVTMAASDSDHVRFLNDLNRPDAGVVSIRVRPDTRRLKPVLSDLLAAIGVRHDVSGSARNVNESEYHTIVWFVANSVTDVVVAGVEALPPALCRDLIRIALVAGARLWLVGDHMLPDPLLEVLAEWPVRPVPQCEFDQRFATVPEPINAVPTAVAFPHVVPSADFPVGMLY